MLRLAGGAARQAFLWAQGDGEVSEFASRLPHGGGAHVTVRSLQGDLTYVTGSWSNSRSPLGGCQLRILLKTEKGWPAEASAPPRLTRRTDRRNCPLVSSWR